MVFETDRSSVGSNGYELTPKEKVKDRIKHCCFNCFQLRGLSELDLVCLVNSKGCQLTLPSIESMETTCIHGF